MNKFLKLAIVPLAFLVTGTMNSCAISPKEIALITDIGDINDGSFNQESWEAVKEYATQNHKSFDFYRPFNDSEFARICSVKQAVAKGAKVIVLPGFKFAGTCASVYSKYPKVNFVLIDTYIDQDKDHSADNVCCIGFKSELSGFSAGYTVATDLLMRDWEEKQELKDKYGYGYCGGMASNGTLEFGFGFVQGVIRATADFCKDEAHLISNKDKPQININYHYAQVFAQDDKATADMKGWLSSDKGIKVLFPCGGKLYQSATEAVQHYNKHYVKGYDKWLKSKDAEAPRDAARWIGVDSDQYRGLKYDHEKKSIYTSALKGLKRAIDHALQLHYAGNWNLIGGYHNPDPHKVPFAEVSDKGQWILGMHSRFGDSEEIDTDNFVGIPSEEYDEETHVIRGFEKYTIEQCEDLLHRLIAGEGETIEVYGGDGTDLGKPKGDPTDMPNWEVEEGLTFDNKYMGAYPTNKIDLKYI